MNVELILSEEMLGLEQTYERATDGPQTSTWKWPTKITMEILTQPHTHTHIFMSSL